MASTKKVIRFKWLAACAVLASVSGVHGQLLIDRSGGRDVFFSGDFAADKRLRTRFDSSEKSLSASYFGTALDPWFPRGNFLIGLRGKVTATDGWEEFFQFERLPGLEVSLLGNWTSISTNGLIPFANVRVAYRHEDYALVDPARPVAEQFSKPSFDGVSAAVSLGALFQIPKVTGQFGAAISLGYERTSNYQELSKINVTDAFQVSVLPNGGQRLFSGGSKTIRQGELETFNRFPLEAIVTYDIGLPRSFYSWIPFVPENNEHGLIFAPYARYEPGDEGKPEHAVGLQFTIRTTPAGQLTFESSTKNYSKYPISVFIEGRNAFGGKSETKAGVALVYTF